MRSGERAPPFAGYVSPLDTSSIRPSCPTYGVTGTMMGAPARVRLVYSTVMARAKTGRAASGQPAGLAHGAGYGAGCSTASLGLAMVFLLADGVPTV